MNLKDVETKLAQASYSLDGIRGWVTRTITACYATGEDVPEISDDFINMLNASLKGLSIDTHQIGTDVQHKAKDLREGCTLLKDRVVPAVPVESVRLNNYTSQIPSIAVVDGAVQYPDKLVIKELPKNKEI